MDMDWPAILASGHPESRAALLLSHTTCLLRFEWRGEQPDCSPQKEFGLSCCTHFRFREIFQAYREEYRRAMTSSVHLEGFKRPLSGVEFPVALLRSGSAGLHTKPTSRTLCLEGRKEPTSGVKLSAAVVLQRLSDGPCMEPTSRTPFI